MRDIKTYLSVAPVLSTLWFGALAGLLIEINRLFPDALSFPFFNSSYSYTRDKIIRDMTKIFFQSFFSIRSKKKEKMDWVEPQSHQKFGKSHFGRKHKFN
ncbi:hypothetical protein QOZ80_7AG0564350 [Eleusine coracana subsp. coracana]|nr:hypothetical protein QOZ80_7AG0564350 [Eleusine coracana subsp. coracana]